MKKNTIFLLIFIIILSLTACSIESNLSKIEKYIAEEKYELAEEKILKLLNKYGDNKEIYDLYIEVIRKKDEKDKLILTLKEGIEKFSDIAYKEELLDLYIEKLKLEEAENLGLEIIEEDKSNKTYLKLFNIFENQNKELEWLKVYEENKEHIKDDYILLETALIYLEDNNLEKSQEIIKRIDIDSLDSIENFELLAEYYFKIKDDTNSYKTAKKGIEYMEDSTILYGYIYGYMNSDGLEIIELHSEDINGDGIKENIVLLSENEDSSRAKNTIMTIQNGNNGDVLTKSWLESYVSYKDILFEDFNGDGIKDIYINTYSREETSLNPEIYSFKEDNLKLITENYGYNNLKYKLKDNYILEISSGELEKKINLYLDEDREKYISNGIFDKDGSLLVESSLAITDTIFLPVYLEDMDYYGFKKIDKLKINKEDVGDIESLYQYENNRLVFKDFYAKSKYKTEESKYGKEDLVAIEDIELKTLENLLNCNKKTLYQRLGKPSKINYQQGEVLAYDGIQFYLDKESQDVSYIKIIESNNTLNLKIPVRIRDIKNELGDPDEEKRDSLYKDEIELIYYLDKVKLRFIGNKKTNSDFILIVEKN